MAMKGVCKFFQEKKGFGFISVIGQPKDFFVHYSALEGEGFKTLAEGQAVEFDVLDAPKGPQAINVRKI